MRILCRSRDTCVRQNISTSTTNKTRTGAYLARAKCWNAAVHHVLPGVCEHNASHQKVFNANPSAVCACGSPFFPNQTVYRVTQSYISYMSMSSCLRGSHSLSRKPTTIMWISGSHELRADYREFGHQVGSNLCLTH